MTTSKLTDEFLERVVSVALGMTGEDRTAGITFAMACYEAAGKKPPDFRKASEGG